VIPIRKPLVQLLPDPAAQRAKIEVRKATARIHPRTAINESLKVVRNRLVIDIWDVNIKSHGKVGEQQPALVNLTMPSWAFFSARNCSALRARSGLTPLPAAPGPGRTECCRRLLLQCGFSRSAVKGISFNDLDLDHAAARPATTTRKWHDAGGGRRGRWLALVRFAAIPVAISGSVAKTG
jgi:hypothetical protein